MDVAQNKMIYIYIKYNKIGFKNIKNFIKTRTSNLNQIKNMIKIEGVCWRNNFKQSYLNEYQRYGTET